MRRMLIAAALLIPLAGCTWLANTFSSTPSAETQTVTVHVVLDACDVFYKGAMKAAFVADDAHLLTPAVKADIHSARVVVDAICPPNGTMPTNLTAAAVSIIEAAAKINADLGVKP